MSGESKPGSPFAALAVHAFTASGAVLGLLALHAAVDRRWTTMFLWLGAALVVDGIDGTFARALKVGEALPRISGEVLDLIIDYLTYVIVPAYALALSGLLPEGLGWPLAAAIALSSAFYFADTAMKTAEGGFRGFPAIWNIAAFVLFVVAAPPAVNAVVVLGLIAATFAPFVFVHPLRVRRLRIATFATLALWSVAAALALLHSLAPPAWVTGLLVVSSLYFFAAAFAFGRARPAKDLS
jgi:phosphatidylcholine synthase